MRLKLKILISLLLLSLVSFSQKDTSKICIPYTTAQKIAQDLVRGDLCESELSQTNTLVQTLEAKSSIKDSIISVYIQKDSLRVQELQAKQKIVQATQDKNKELEKQTKRLKAINKFLSYTTVITTVVAVLGLVIIL